MWNDCSVIELVRNCRQKLQFAHVAKFQNLWNNLRFWSPTSTTEVRRQILLKMETKYERNELFRIFYGFFFLQHRCVQSKSIVTSRLFYDEKILSRCEQLPQAIIFDTRTHLLAAIKENTLVEMARDAFDAPNVLKISQPNNSMKTRRRVN